MEDIAEQIIGKSYETAHDLHKFYVSFRFKIVAFLATVNGALFFFWSKVFNSNGVDGFSLVVISFAGVVACLSLWLLDRRNRQLFEICIGVAKSIESAMSLKDLGIYEEIAKRPKNRFAHGRVIRYVAFLGLLLWCFLLVGSIDLMIRNW